MIGRRHEIAWLQSDFYRVTYRRIILALLLSVSIMMILIGVILYLILVNPSARYFATTTQGKIIPMAPSQAKH